MTTETTYYDGLTLDQRQHYTQQERFLLAYSFAGRLYLASQSTGISVHTVESWQRRDTHGFQKRLLDAHKRCTERWEEIMDARLQDPQGNRGSDPLLMFKLKALDPAKYREDVRVLDSGVGKRIFDTLVAAARDALPAPVEAPVVEAVVREIDSE